ncbi:MAG: type VI secretion system tube protein Hcp [Roseateles sp.]|nr:MAG: type VI secretion system tube protein Hcp [Roseateles sp.]
MPNLSRWLRAAALMLGLSSAGAALAANTYFLQLPGMPGDATDKGHEHWVAIDSFSWGVSNHSSAGGTGKASFDDLGWTQLVDSSTPKFFVAVATGASLDKVTLDVQQLVSGSAQTFFQMIFEGSIASGLSLSGSGGPVSASAAITSGNRVTLRYRPQDAKGGLGAWVEGVFNLATNSPTITFEGDSAVLTGLFASGATLNFDATAITPVPEPATAALLLVGLLLVSRRRRRA